MRVLFVPKIFPSGAEPNAGIFILRRVQAMQALGHDVSVLRIVPAAPPLAGKWNAYRSIPKREEIGGIPVHTIRAPIPPRMIGMEYVPLFLRRALEREIRAFRADLVHASFLIPCGQLVVRQRLVPSLVTAHGVDAYKWPAIRRGLRAASREAVQRADGVTAVSEYIAQCLRRLADVEVRVIWNGADERYFYPRERAACRAKFDVPPGAKILAFAGNLLRAKGLFDLVEAVRAIPPEHRPIVLLAGRGSDEQLLQDAVANAGIDVRFLGHLESEQIGELFGAADAVVLPSHAEGLPNVVCEAMLSGRAIVATTVGGIPEIVTNGYSGVLVAPNRPVELSQAIERVMSSDTLRDTLALQARDFAVDHLTWAVSAKSYEAYYREVLERATS